MEGAGHVPWDVILSADVLAEIVANLIIGNDLANAQAPAGCDPQSTLFMQ